MNKGAVTGETKATYSGHESLPKSVYAELKLSKILQEEVN